MSISSEACEHPLVAGARVVGAALEEMADVDPLYLTAQEKAQVLAEVTRSLARLAALRAGVLAPGWQSRPARHTARRPWHSGGGRRSESGGPGSVTRSRPGG
jgi:hypothetical protein